MQAQEQAKMQAQEQTKMQAQEQAKMQAQAQRVRRSMYPSALTRLDAGRPGGRREG
ncbi:hypothetical protein [Marinobacter alexandrii]|uniref:hypothetical protein n=1 Tax=Marinobacter alexandrii TaxID=2570351 RepID=UPI003296F751